MGSNAKILCGCKSFLMTILRMNPNLLSEFLDFRHQNLHTVIISYTIARFSSAFFIDNLFDFLCPFPQ